MCGTTPLYADPAQIGSVPTPWPSWLIAAHPSADRAPPDALRVFLANLTDYVRSFDSAASREGAGLEFIKAKWGYPEVDIKVSSRNATSETCVFIRLYRNG